MDTQVPYKGRCRGHDCLWEVSTQQWYWVDTGEPLDTNVAIPRRSCWYCEKEPTIEGYDACLGEIPGASEACCGHGRDVGYITWPGVYLSGKRGTWLASIRITED